MLIEGRPTIREQSGDPLQSIGYSAKTTLVDHADTFGELVCCLSPSLARPLVRKQCEDAALPSHSQPERNFPLNQHTAIF